jgi:hypothetical protein
VRRARESDYYELIQIDTSVKAITSKYEFDARKNERASVWLVRQNALGLHTRASCTVAHAALANAPKLLTLNKRVRATTKRSSRDDAHQKFCVRSRPPLRDHHIRDNDFIGPPSLFWGYCDI